MKTAIYLMFLLALFASAGLHSLENRGVFAIDRYY